jgi:hypothetical protein
MTKVINLDDFYQLHRYTLRGCFVGGTPRWTVREREHGAPIRSESAGGIRHTAPQRGLSTIWTTFSEGTATPFVRAGW